MLSQLRVRGRPYRAEWQVAETRPRGGGVAPRGITPLLPREDIDAHLGGSALLHANRLLDGWAVQTKRRSA